LGKMPGASNRNMKLLLINRISAAVVSLGLLCLCSGDAATSPLPQFELPALEVSGSRLDLHVLQPPPAERAFQLYDEFGVRGSVYDDLEAVAGALVGRPGGMAGNPVFHLRGAEPNFSKTFIDGIEVNNLTDVSGGGYNFNALAVEAIEAVEVLAGSQSAIHGSDALGGVLRVQTLPDQIGQPGMRGETYAAVAGGGYYSIGLDATHATDSLLYKVHVNRAEEQDLLPGYAFEAWRGHFGSLAQLAPRLTLKVSGLAAEMRRAYFPEDSGGPAFAVVRESETARSKEAGLALQAAYAIDAVGRFHLSAQAYQMKTRVRSPGVAAGLRDPFGIPANEFDNDFTRMVATAYLQSAPTEQWQWVLGGSFRREQGDSESIVRYPFGELAGRYDLLRDTWSGFLETGVALTKEQFVGIGLRSDAVSGKGTVTTSRIRYRIALASEFSVEAAYGEGFKSPGFFALGNPVVGNPDLQPETSDSIDVSLAMRLPRIQGSSRLTVFRQRFTRLIDFSEGPPPQLVNLGGVETSGLTWQLQARPLAQWQASLWASYLSVRVPDGGSLRQRPRWMGGLAIGWQPLQQLSFALSCAHVGTRLDSSIPTGTRPLAAYTVVDFNLTWALLPTLHLEVGIENLLDHRYTPVIGVEAPGRRLQLLLRNQF
jgi:iron complex outermembrane receptor protein/vitamin B12 transporter